MIRLVTALALLTAATPAAAQLENFHPGPAIPEFGPIADVETTVAIPEDAVFRIAFDVPQPGEAGKINRTIESAARFINMHVAAGVPAERIHLAVVVHGRAATDMVDNAIYAPAHDGADNANAAAIATLAAQGVKVYVCGQSAAAYGVSTAQLLPGVVMALSAMTQHALLQQQGYTLNPF